MNRDSRIAQNPEVVARQLAEPEGGVLLHLETGAYHGLNQVGFIIWDHIDGQRTVADLVGAVRGRMPDAPPQVEQDVLTFLRGALDRDLVRLVD